MVEWPGGRAERGVQSTRSPQPPKGRTAKSGRRKGPWKERRNRNIKHTSNSLDLPVHVPEAPRGYMG